MDQSDMPFTINGMVPDVLFTLTLFDNASNNARWQFTRYSLADDFVFQWLWLFFCLCELYACMHAINLYKYACDCVCVCKTQPNH